jgi:TolB-like protein/tetratricopeptide (TPR) repeat protein
VLPFVNISGDKEQEYFSDGLTEELLSSLSRINELQVAAGTSAFSFKGKDSDIGTIARKLNVASVLEGSVRRSGHRIRITAQLNNAVTGFHIWSQSYDRDLGDTLKLQTDIATAVAGALQVTLLGDVGARIELGGSRNPAAVDEYLRGTTRGFAAHTPDDYLAAIVSFSEAVRLDPNYALAFAGRSLALSNSVCGKCAALTRETPWLTARARRDTLDKALADAREAIARAPELAEGHLALGWVLENSLDFARAKTAYERALTLAPGSARVLKAYGAFAVNMGWADAGIAALRRALVLDRLNRNAHRFLGEALFNLRRYQDSITAYREALAIDPDDSLAYADIGISYYALGDFQEARSWCEAKPDPFASACLALTYDKLGRHADAAAELAKFRTDSGDAYPYWNALIYAGWGDTVKALEWLERDMMRDRDWYLVQLKVDPFLDSLRNEPRFQAIERELKFPN